MLGRVAVGEGVGGVGGAGGLEGCNCIVGFEERAGCEVDVVGSGGGKEGLGYGVADSAVGACNEDSLRGGHFDG